MDFKEIQELIKLFGKSEVADLHIEKDDFYIRLRKPEAIKHKAGIQPVVTQSLPQQPAIQTSAAFPQESKSENSGTEDKNQEKASGENGNNENLITIKSPMIGTFYRSPSPDKDPFIKVGDDITKGSVLCIIEAMKLFNEIESEYEGKIVKILVEDSSPVEYDQPLFLIEPVN